MARLLARRAFPVGLLVAASGFAPRASRRVLCNENDRFFGTRQQGEDEEVAKLRRENADLKRRLERNRGGGDEDEGGLLDGIAKFFGKKEETALEKQQKAMSREIDQVFKGTGILGSVIGGLAKGVAGMASTMMAETAQDMDAALRAVERRLAARLGDDVVCDAPFQQAYSSSSFNGQVSKQIQGVTRARGAKGEGTVRFVAVIDGSGRVDIQSLDLEGAPVSGAPSLRDKDKGVIIDV